MPRKLITAITIALFSIALLTGLAKAEDYIITATANGKPITITVSITDDGVTAKSSDKSVQIIGVTPPVTVTKALTLTNAEVDYLNSIGEAVDLYNRAFTENERLMGALLTNPSLINSTVWAKQMKSALENILTAAQIVDSTIPPKRFSDAHGTLASASEHLVGYVYWIATYFEEFDQGAFDLATQEAQDGADLYRQAMDEYQVLLEDIER